MLYRTDFKVGVNHIRQHSDIVKNGNEKIKWFNNLSFYEKQEYTKNYFGRKGCTMPDCNKILFYNKIHNC